MNVTPMRRNSISREEWAAKIRKRSGNEVESIIARGSDLSEARGQLPKAEFKKLWKDDLRYSKPTVSELIKIARCERLKTFAMANLPPSQRTLYELSKLTDKQFAAAVEAGKIHPGMERRDVSALRGKSRKANPSKSKHITPIDRCAMQVRSLVLAAIDETEPAEWAALIAELRSEIDDIEKVAAKKREER